MAYKVQRKRKEMEVGLSKILILANKVFSFWSNYINMGLMIDEMSLRATVKLY